jgi:hypothetical protein
VRHLQRAGLYLCRYLILAYWIYASCGLYSNSSRRSSLVIRGILAEFATKPLSLRAVSSATRSRAESLTAADAATRGVRAAFAGARHAIHRACIIHTYSEICAVRLSIPIARVLCSRESNRSDKSRKAKYRANQKLAHDVSFSAMALIAIKRCRPRIVSFT